MNNMHGRWCNSTWRNESIKIKNGQKSVLKYQVTVALILCPVI